MICGNSTKSRAVISLLQDEMLARTLQMEEDRNYVVREPEPTYDVLKEYRENVRAMITPKATGMQIVSIDENPHAKVGSKLYNRFVEALQLVQDQSIELGFHGTAEENIDAICEHGLDPAKRKRQAMGPGEYFAKVAHISLDYCNGGKRMLVMALLVDKTGLTADQKSVLVIHKPEHHLPLFVISFVC
jgi:Poly(ADP-ribose) polymerase catalytic domain